MLIQRRNVNERQLRRGATGQLASQDLAGECDGSTRLTSYAAPVPCRVSAAHLTLIRAGAGAGAPGPR